MVNHLPWDRLWKSAREPEAAWYHLQKTSLLQMVNPCCRRANHHRQMANRSPKVRHRRKGPELERTSRSRTGSLICRTAIRSRRMVSRLNCWTS